MSVSVTKASQLTLTSALDFSLQPRSNLQSGDFWWWWWWWRWRWWWWWWWWWIQLLLFTATSYDCARTGRQLSQSVTSNSTNNSDDQHLHQIIVQKSKIIVSWPISRQGGRSWQAFGERFNSVVRREFAILPKLHWKKSSFYAYKINRDKCFYCHKRA